MDRRPVTALLLLWAAFLTTDARADGWSSFEAAFPMFPCQDGWMGCRVGGAHVDPDLAHDPAGRAIPSDARIGWFDLQATPAFSPFVGLSNYSDAPVEVAAADPVEEPEAPPAAAPNLEDDAAADAEEARTAKLSADREQRDAEARRREADAAAAKQKQEEDVARKAAADAAKRAGAANAAANADEKARLEREATAAQAKASELEKQRKAAELEAASKREAEVAAQQKAATEATRQKEAEAARLAAEQKAKEEKAKLAALQAAEVQAQQAKAAEAARLAAEKESKATTPTEAPKPGAPANLPTVADGECADTSKLEPISLLGKLTEGTMQCLETRLANAPKMTDKKKISGLLMTDAWAKGDKERWETLIKRHLDEIDQSDPDLCFKYALHLSRQGPGRASGVIRWANVALENRTVWIGDTYTSRVYSLYKVRAAASQSLWEQAEAEHAATPSDESRDKVEKYRNMTKVNAREWYEYAKVSGKDETTALQVCMSAAGTADYCEAR